MKIHEDPIDKEFGKALADRLGLRHDDTLREWSTETTGSLVWVSMTTMKAIPRDEFKELRKVAVGWTCRWIKALAPEVEPIYTEGKLRFEHGGRSFDVRPGNWIVWDVDRFKNVPPGFFNSRYTPVNFSEDKP